MTTPLLDTHQHLLDTDRFSYAWTKGLRALEGRAFTLEGYQADAEGTGIAGTLFMESTPDGSQDAREFAWIAGLAARPGSLIRGIVANGRPEDDGFAGQVESINSPFLRGIRRILHVTPDGLLAQPRFVESLRWLGRRGLPFDLCVVACQHPAALALVDACPGTQFVLDHCGMPEIGRLDPWRAGIRDLALRPNVACKISGVLDFCPPGHASLETVRPYIEHCLEQFGPLRVVWGSNWPMVNLTSSLRDWVRIIRELVAREDGATVRALFHDNAARIYGLSAPSP
jgi:predicted TIM-barrel fold metal-dependent hydrolase